MAMSPAPHPLPPLTASDPGSFYTIVVSGQNFPITASALQYDAPNFFTDIFFNSAYEESRTRFLYIDRNPEVFRDIVKHMQGYYVAAKDEVHQENLILDAHFFKLRRLIETLRQHLYVNVSGTIFKIARETILNDSPNFFALLEPFSDRNLTPTYFCRSPELFKDVLSHLQGYDIHVRDKVHRNNLLKEARYFKLNNLASKLALGTDYIYSGFPTKPEERIKAEVTMILCNINVRHVLVKGWRDYRDLSSSGKERGESLSSHQDEEDIKMDHQLLLQQQPSSSSSSSSSMPANVSKEKILLHNQNLIQSSDLQDLLYKPTADIEPLALMIEISSIELFAIWPGSVNSSMLGDQHLFVYRDQDLSRLNKICKHLGLQSLTMAANVVKLSPNIYFHLDGQSYKGQEELEPIIRKLALTSAKVTPPGRALRLFLGRALVRLGCKSGQLVMTIVKAEGWSSDKEYNACRKYLTDDMKDLGAL
ncbi:hypothetical protein EMPS_09177 [Entomortierella parvispora]|uniref:BTB domain-containing protein n=1 Tax=Entomortierella parvispora TaxID=205924 RepID=A0A9P3HI27_9FUNG|nr:hypothetical protein EMPS_09177 [Entomortierella parvispora]